MSLTRIAAAMLVTACAVAQAGQRESRVGVNAPTPVLVDLDGYYTFLSHLYYEGEEQLRHPRSIVILYFSGLNCPPCHKLLPELLRIVRPVLESSKDTGISMRFYLVSTDPLSAKDQLVEYLKEQTIDIKTEILLDPYRKASDAFGVSSIPHTVVISPKGLITADIVGDAKDFRPLLIEGIRAALRARNEP